MARRYSLYAFVRSDVTSSERYVRNKVQHKVCHRTPSYADPFHSAGSEANRIDANIPDVPQLLFTVTNLFAHGLI
jgi:hypothetical protein